MGPARRQCARLFEYDNYGTFAIDGSLGKRSVLEQLGQYLKWQEQFGYRLEYDEGNLDALRDGFEFPMPASWRFALELLASEVLWREGRAMARWTACDRKQDTPARARGRSV